MFQTLLAFFFPTKEISIQEEAFIESFDPVRIQAIELRAQGIMYLDGLIAVTTYVSSKSLQDAIRLFKYHRRRALASQLGRLMTNAVRLSPHFFPRTMLCPVPLHWSRQFSRGFNQAELLTQEVSTALHLPVSHLLRRVRPTGHQAWRSHDERRLAMKDAFVAQRSTFSHVTLVDDVATTMSTLDACARALKNAGVSHVDAIVIALG